MKFKIKTLLFISLSLIFIQALYSQKTYTGETKTLGNGTVTSWIKVAGDKTPLSIGVTFTESALSGLPKRGDPGGMEILGGFITFEYSLNFPSEASSTPFNHIGMNWNVEGHIPPQFYGVPHFDFHFYTISISERMKIIGVGEDTLVAYKTPSPEFIPKDYILPPMSSEPMMGSHWIDPNSSEFQPGGKFTKTFLFGFYDTKMVFWEPMVTVEYFKTKPNFTEVIKQPSSYQKSGLYYPTSYSIKYDDVNKEYIVSLDGLTKR